MRILTLVVFFNFSGLNNGFTYFIVSSGNIQRIDFAPFLVQRFAAVLHPLSWKRLVIDPIRVRIIGRTKRVIGYASQRAVQNMLIESSIFRVWVMDFLLNAAPARSDDLINGNRIRAGLPLDRFHGQKEVTAVSGRTGIDRVKRISSIRFAQDSVLSRGDRHYGIRDPPGYLQSGRKKSWLMDRYHFWNGHQFKAGHLSEFLIPGSDRFDGNDSLSPAQQRQVKRFVRYAPDRFRIRLIHTLERGEEDADHVLSVKVQKERSRYPKDSGILFIVGHLLMSRTCIRPQERDMGQNPLLDFEVRVLDRGQV